MEPKISILLPTYNEADNIILLIERILCIMQRGENDYEVLVIDDNSPDGTAELVSTTFSRNPFVKLIVRDNERGLTSAVQRGIYEARGRITAWMDSDLSMAPEKIPELVAAIEDQGFDVAIGSRYVPGGRDTRADSGKMMLFIHKFLSWLITRFTATLLWPTFLDWTSGFIAIKSSVIKRFPLTGNYGEYFIDLVYRLLKSGCMIKEIPYNLTPRQMGKSKTATNLLGFFIKGSKYIAFIFRLKFFSKV